MNDDSSKRRLGRGLAALIGEMDQPLQAGASAPAPVNPDRRVPIEFVSRNPRNPRRQFDEAELQDLANSIRQHGIVQPVVARTIGADRYEIIAGERRWRAAQLAGFTEIPVIIRDVTIARRSRSRSSKTFSARISTRSTRRSAMSS